MNVVELLYELFYSFALSGGLGYITTKILTEMGLIHVSKEDKLSEKLCLAFFSFISILIYLFFEQYTKMNFCWDIFWTFITIILFSFTLFKWIIKLFWFILNIIRIRDNRGTIDKRPVNQIIFDKDEVLYAYLYSYDTNMLITYGTVGWFSDNLTQNFEIEITPSNSIEEMKYDDALKLAKKVENSSVYLNIDKKIKIVVIPKPKDD